MLTINRGLTNRTTKGVTPMTHQATSPADAGEHAPFITLLGTVAVRNARGPIEDDHREGQLTRIAAWLVLNPGGSASEMERDLWVAGIRANTRNTAVSRLRKWLGNGPDGQPYLPRHGHDHGYALHSSIRSDWHIYLSLIAGGVNRTPFDDLMTALNLVQGAPFTSTAGDYGWAEATCETMAAVIRDTAHVAAINAVRTRQLDKARYAISKGYLVDDEDEVLARDELLTEVACGNRRGVQRIADRLLAQRGHGLQPETLSLLRRVRPAPSPTVSCLRRSGLVRGGPKQLTGR